MSTSPVGQNELLKLLEAACEERLSAEQVTRLEDVLTESEECRKLYREYMMLHGMLYWDTAVGSKSDVELPQSTPGPSTRSPQTRTASARFQRISWTVGLVSAIAIIAGIFLSADPSPQPSESVVTNPSPENSIDQVPEENLTEPIPKRDRKPAKIQADVGLPKSDNKDQSKTPRNFVAETPVENEKVLSAGSSDQTILAFVNTELKSHWSANSIKPSPVAQDSEWLRRVHLDLIGQIPTAEEAAEFIASKDSR